MSSIGPQLPPELTKRKRTPEDDDPTSPPVAKRTNANQDRRAYGDEDSSDDDYGPSAPATNEQSIGPTMPPQLRQPTPGVIGPRAVPSGGGEEAGPRAPSPAAKRPVAGPALPPSNTAEISLEDESHSDSDTAAQSAPAPSSSTARPAPSGPKRIHGPAPPPAPLSERPPDSKSDSESDSDDGYGPALPTSQSHLARQSEAAAAAAREAAHPKAPQRDDWMLAPPTAGGYRAPDPTKLKARKFNSGPRGGSGGDDAGAGAGGISSIWTETPEQKRKRLENAVLGRADSSTAEGQQQQSAGPRMSRAEEERAAQIRDNIEAARGRSLYDEHQKREGGKGGKIEEEEDDPSKRAFDREKDMKLGGRIGNAQRKELMTRAADFSGRFSKGKYL